MTREQGHFHRSIEDFGSYEEMLEWGDVKNREEYEQYPCPSWDFKLE